MPTSYPAGSSISRSTPPSVISKGIKYIKINRFDKQGNDNTLSLQELTNLRVKFNDLDIVDFPILTIAEYPDYYLYRVGPVILGDSTEKFKSPTSPTTSTNTYLLTAGSNTSPIFYGYTDITGSIGGTGLYNFPNGGYTVTATCYFSASASPGAFKADFYILFTGSDGITSKQPFIPNNGTGVVTGSYSASISYVPTSGSTLGIAFASSSINVNFNLPSIDFRITQDVTSSIDNNVLDYTINASKTGTTSVAGDDSVIITNYNTVTTDTLGYFNTSSGLITFGDTPNVKMYVTASVTVPDNHQDFSLLGSSEGRIVMTNTSNPTGGTLIISASFTPIENSTYWLFIENNSSGPSSYSNVNLLLTQSVDPHSSTNLTVLEPYLLSTFTDSDCDVLMNNANGLEYDVNFMSVNYDGNGGTVIPSNQQEILNNTAERAPVKPYNYAAHAQILPRYNGVKTTSKEINKWNGPSLDWEGDSNTYGKLPTVELSNIFVAYCDVIEENTPEIMNASYAHIKYLIDENGDIRTPNVSENSLPDVQDTFIPNENISIYSSTQNVGEITDLKSIIKGGQRVETVLYDQIGSNPITWSPTITLSDNSISSSLVKDYQVLLGTAIPYSSPSYDFWADIDMEIIYSSGSDSDLDTSSSPPIYNRYRITADMVADGVALLFNINCYLKNPMGTPGSIYIRLYNYTQNHSVGSDFGYPSIPAFQQWSVGLNVTLNPWDLIIGDEYGIQVTVGHPGNEYVVPSSPTYGKLKVSQIPTPTNIITTAGLFQSGSLSSTYGNNVLFTTQSSLVNTYNTSTVFQQQIVGSGFNTSSLNWNILPGDEFRFEGREDRVYMVENVYITDPSQSISGSPALIINLNNPILSSSIMDVNHFIIRRYIDDPSSILFSGAKPFNSTAPFIIKPQYITNLLNKNIDKYIVNLTGKNIITP